MVALAITLVSVGNANAATVVNGDFETGTLSGWQTYIQNENPESVSGWFPYTGRAAPLFTAKEVKEGEEEEAETGFESPPLVQAPPQGKYAAISSEGGPSLHILYQDVTLEPYWTHTLSLLAYYTSYAPISIPSPDTLNVSGGPGLGQPNQQFRIDVMKPTAPIESLNPSDILATAFATKVGDPERMTPATFTANLTPFAGQTVRLRIADVDNEFYMHAGVDAVSIASTPPSNAFTHGAAKPNKKNGTAKVQLSLPGAGVVAVQDASTVGASASVSAKKAHAALIRKASLTVAAAGPALVTLKPTAAGRKILEKRHKLKVKALVTFTPTGGFAASQTVGVTLKLKAKHKPKK